MWIIIKLHKDQYTEEEQIYSSFPSGKSFFPLASLSPLSWKYFLFKSYLVIELFQKL